MMTFLRDELPFLIEQKNRVLTRLYDHEPLTLAALTETVPVLGGGTRRPRSWIPSRSCVTRVPPARG